MKIKKCFISCSEMPNSCMKCEFYSPKVMPYVPCGTNYCLLNVNIGTNNYYRPSGCPLVGLPEKHGKLIDADALWMDIIRSMDYCDDILKIIEAQPVVVEGEK